MNDLVEDVILHIFTFLTMFDVGKLGQTSTYFQALANRFSEGRLKQCFECFGLRHDQILPIVQETNSLLAGDFPLAYALPSFVAWEKQFKIVSIWTPSNMKDTLTRLLEDSVDLVQQEMCPKPDIPYTDELIKYNIRSLQSEDTWFLHVMVCPQQTLDAVFSQGNSLLMTVMTASKLITPYYDLMTSNQYLMHFRSQKKHFLAYVNGEEDISQLDRVIIGDDMDAFIEAGFTKVTPRNHKCWKSFNCPQTLRRLGDGGCAHTSLPLNHPLKRSLENKQALAKQGAGVSVGKPYYWVLGGTLCFVRWHHANSHRLETIFNFSSYDYQPKESEWQDLLISPAGVEQIVTELLTLL